MTPSSHTAKKGKSCCACYSGTCERCTCAHNNRGCISCKTKKCTRTSKSINNEQLVRTSTQTIGASPVKLDTEKPILSHTSSPPVPCSSKTVPITPTHPTNTEPQILPSNKQAPTTSAQKHQQAIPAHSEASCSRTSPKECTYPLETVLIGDVLMSNVLASDLSGRCTLHNININDYSAMFEIIESANPFKNYIIVLTDHVEIEEVTKLSTAILAKNSNAKIYMAEPLNLKTIEQRHCFMSLCYSLKLRVIPTGKLRDESTGAPDVRLFHPENASLNESGIIRFFDTVARYVPHWVNVLPSHYYNNVTDKHAILSSPPFLCFPSLHGHPVASSPHYMSPRDVYSRTTHTVAPPHHTHTNNYQSITPIHHYTNNSRSAPPYHTHTNSFRSAPPHHTPTNCYKSSPLHHSQNNSIQSAPPRHPLGTSHVSTTQSYSPPMTFVPFHHTKPYPLPRYSPPPLSTTLSNSDYSSAPPPHFRYPSATYAQATALPTAFTPPIYYPPPSTHPPPFIPPHILAQPPPFNPRPQISKLGFTRPPSPTHTLNYEKHKRTQGYPKYTHNATREMATKFLNNVSRSVTEDHIRILTEGSIDGTKNNFPIGRMSMQVKKNGRPFHRDTNIDTILNDLKLKRQATPADGHCILHAVKGSLVEQIGLNDKHLLEEIKIKAMEEAYNLIDDYHSFTDYPKRDQRFLCEIENYFENKVYDSTFGDLVPAVLSTALKTQITILDETKPNDVTSTVMNPNNLKSDEVAQYSIFVIKEKDHYSSLAPIQPMKPQFEQQNIATDLNKHIEANVLCSNRYSPLQSDNDTSICDEEMDMQPYRSDTNCSGSKKI